MNDNSGVPCEIECGITEEQAIAKLYEHDQELVRGIIKRIREHQQTVCGLCDVLMGDNKEAKIGKECYGLAHESIIALLKKEWGIDG